MNKKRIALFTLIIFGLIIGIVLVYFMVFQSKNKNLTLEDIEKDSSIIVRGVYFEKKSIDIDENKEKEIIKTTQISNFRIEEVYKNNTSQKLESELVIPIVEKSVYRPDRAMENTYYTDGYSGMDLDHEYILFLKYLKDKKQYVPIKYGKIPIDLTEQIISRDEKNPTKESDKEFAMQDKIAEHARKKYQ